MKKVILVVALVVASFVFTLTAVSSQEVDGLGPKEQLQRTIDNILNVLRSDSIDAVTKKHKISALVRQRFDYEIMSQGVLGRNWRLTSLAQRRKFIDLFTQLLETTYLNRISAYKGQQIVYTGAKIRRNKAVVDTVLKNGGTDIPITYKQLLKDGHWVVYDVVIENVSLIRNYRSSYNNILRNKGMTTLLKEMEQKIKSLSTDEAQSQQEAA